MSFAHQDERRRFNPVAPGNSASMIRDPQTVDEHDRPDLHPLASPERAEAKGAKDVVSAE
jgi:hypothetical protein